MSKPRNPRQREGNEIEFSRIVAFSDGVFAMGAAAVAVLFIDPAEVRRGRRASGRAGRS